MMRALTLRAGIVGLLAGAMLGALAVELRDTASLHLGTLGFDKVARCLVMGP